MANAHEDLLVNTLGVVAGVVAENAKRFATESGHGELAAVISVFGQMAAKALAGHAGELSIADAREQIGKLITELPAELAQGDAAVDAYIKRRFAATDPLLAPLDVIDDRGDGEK